MTGVKERPAKGVYAPEEVPMVSHLSNLDTHFDPAAIISLSERRLIVEPDEKWPLASLGHAELAERAAGAFAGAAIGSAMGAPLEWLDPNQVRERFGWVSGYTDSGRRGGPRWTSDVDLLIVAADSIAVHGIDSAIEMASKLPGLARRRVRLPGEAFVESADRVQQGFPWFEAGVGSFGDGCLLRGVASGLKYHDAIFERCTTANFNAAVTHATKEAVKSAVTVANIIAAILASPKGQIETGKFRKLVVASIPNRRYAGKVEAVLADASSHNRSSSSGSSRDRLLIHAPTSGATAQIALLAALWHFVANPGSPRAAIESAVNAGGDTDTVAALTGAFAGTCHGINSLPSDLISGLPRVDETLAASARLVGGEAGQTPSALEETDKSEAQDSDGAPCHVSFLIDRSGSMMQLHRAVIDGFNELLNEQQTRTGECSMTLAAFDSEDPFELVVNDQPIGDVKPLTEDELEPRAMTPLFDAIYSTIKNADKRLSDRKKSGLDPDDQLVVVFTDGLENASHKHDHAQVMDLIAERKKKGWTFTFLGANQDSYATGAGLGVAAGNVSNFDYTDDGMRRAAASVSRSVRSYRHKSRGERMRDRDDFFEGIKEAERSW